MRFSLNFIKEFFKVDIPAQKIADKLTMTGMEVEHFEKIGNDWVFDIEVTTNRYDWLSILGIARELAAALGRKVDFKYPVLEKKAALTEKKIIIEDREDCPYYLGREIENVKIGETNKKIKELLLNCGLNSVNDVVDITNYCMLKWGNPLHAFDRDKIEGDIYIRRAKSNELFIGLDSKERILNKENLVISDAKKVIALAGVMGAKNTEVDEKTKNIFLEAAIFSPVTVRRSRRAAGLDTESSYRFERMVSGENLNFAAFEASGLITKISGGSLAGIRQAGSKPLLPKKKLAVDLNKLNAYLGVCIPKSEVKKILGSLGFTLYKGSGNKLKISSPGYRFDIQSSVDIYEEVSRIWGYDKIPSTIPFLPSGSSQKALAKDTKKNFYHFNNKLRELLALLKFREIMTYSIDDQDTFMTASEEERVKITNPLKKREDTLRTNLFLGMAKSLRHNLNRDQGTLSFFEIADVYTKNKNGFLEKPVLSLGISGAINNFFKLKAAIISIFDNFNISDISFKEKSQDKFSNALEVLAGKDCLGFLGKLDVKQKEALNLKEDVFFGQLDIALLSEKSGKKAFNNFSPYPTVWRDISISLRKDVKFKEIKKIIQDTSSYLSGLQIIEFYKGKDIGKDWTAFTLRIFYQSSKETLTAQEVDSFHNDIRNKLNLKDGINLR